MFKDLEHGDMFNTKIARWVKIDDDTAIVVMSGIMVIGCTRVISGDTDVIVLYSRKNKIDTAKQVAGDASKICGCAVCCSQNHPDADVAEFTKVNIPLTKMVMRCNSQDEG